MVGFNKILRNIQAEGRKFVSCLKKCVFLCLYFGIVLKVGLKAYG